MGFKKIMALMLALCVILLTLTVGICAEEAEGHIEVILKDVTAEDTTTLKGEAKILVSVKGATGKVNAVQTALAFEGELKYKSIDFLVGENNPPTCFLIPPNAALANNTGELLPAIVTNNAGRLTFGEEETELFVLTFAGEPGDSVTVSLNGESAAGSYCSVDGKIVMAKEDAESSAEASASKEDNEGIEAEVIVSMTVVKDMAVTAGSGNGYADSKLTLTITSEKREGSTISTVLNTVSDVNGGHYSTTVLTPPTFIVKNTVVGGDGETYTVKLEGPGYVPVEITGVDFEKPLEITNEQFVPGDINSDGEVDLDDKAIYEKMIAGEETDYEDIYADFNRDEKVDKYDNVFGHLTEKEKTAPAKMSKPVLKAEEEGEMTVTWKAPDDGGSPITGYIIKYGKSSKLLTATEEIDDGSKTEITIDKLDDGATYYFKIAAINAIGTGEFSDNANAKTIKPEGGGGGGSFGGGAETTKPEETTKPTETTKPEETAKPEEGKTPAATDEVFTDLANYGWAKDYIYTLKNKGIISGVSATEYAPGNNIKRGDFVLILTRMLSVTGEFTENFADVPESSYYYDAIGRAKAAGIAQGSGANFMPENTITRQDLITLAYRAFLAKGYIEETEDSSILDTFGDKDKISDYAKTAMASMVKAGIIKGSDDGNVNPMGFATRAEVAVMCARLVELIK
ncbi:MAG: S-layer homology domain-containing protein [Clostridia bacterium]|nr:S-layer homology domain-containing protein [Clostridia bacterium]